MYPYGSLTCSLESTSQAAHHPMCFYGRLACSLGSHSLAPSQPLDPCGSLPCFAELQLGTRWAPVLLWQVDL